jgi:ankyrin repeat protein
MDSLPLPPRPRLDFYRKRAKDLVGATRSPDADAIRQWAHAFLGAVVSHAGDAGSFARDSFDRAVEHIADRVGKSLQGGREFRLADAQFLLANAHGFGSWGDFARHIEDAGAGRASPFERAADAVITGDLGALRALLDDHRALIHERSARVHRATLLHYVAANGVEDFRQKTPDNAVAVAQLLLERGAVVDALAETYGGDDAQTTMNLLVSSAHPADKGLQPPLIDLLLDHGAAINGLADDGSPIMTALGFWYGDAANTLAARGARLDNVVSAASVGREDLVRGYVIDRDTLAPGVGHFTTRWFSTPADPQAHIEMAFASACHFRQEVIARYFLEIGVDIAAKDKDGMTPLHWAAANGMTRLMEDLLRRQAPLEVKNAWHGTVLDSTLHFAVFMPVKGVDYLPVVERLIAAGANTSVIDPYPDHPLIDYLRRRVTQKH